MVVLGVWKMEGKGKGVQWFSGVVDITHFYLELEEICKIGKILVQDFLFCFFGYI